MLGVLFLIGSTLLGFGLIRRILHATLDGVEQILWGIVSGWVLASLGVYFVARGQGRLTPSLIVWATIIVVTGATLLILTELRSSRFSLASFLECRRQYLGLAIIWLLLLPIYWRVLSVQAFPRGDGGIYSGSAGNDLNFHAALISSFSYGQNFPPQYTLLPPEPLLYPFMPDFHAAILMTGGLSLRSAIFGTGLLLGAVIAGLFYAFALRISRSPRAATLATLLFLLNGGLGFFYFLRDLWQTEKPRLEFWRTLPFNYANLSERGIHWTNLVTDLMVPQRTGLFGLSLGLMILTVFAFAWRRWHESEARPAEAVNRPRTIWLMIIAGLLAGVLPLFHTHTYVAVGLISGVLFVLKPRRAWLAFWAPAILVAAPQLLTLAAHARGGGIVRFLPGWLGHNEQFFPLYLLRNFGLPLILAIPAWWAAPREWRKFYLAFLFLFGFSFLIVFSPNAFDNGKVTYYWHACNSVLVAIWLIKLATVHRQRVLAVVLAFLSIATALVVFHRETIVSERIFTDEELSVAAIVRNQTAPRALFLTAPTFKSPITSLSGRPVVRSATPWLWSHGYEFRARESDVRGIYAGSTDALELLRYYAVDFVYLGDAERSDLRANAAFFDANLPLFYVSQTITIYDARRLRDQSAGGSYPNTQRDLASRLDRDPYAVIEAFPDTSFFVYRLCQVSYGRRPRRQEFMSAMGRLGQGLITGSSDWNAQLERNRAAMLQDWIAAREFKQLYDGKSNSELVVALLKNAGVNWSESRRNELVNQLSSQTEPLPTALRAVVDDRDFSAREYNNAYVLAHYFGYLRRNPDEAPDFDLKGFNLWRDRLNSEGDYRAISLAFLESIEYRNLKLAP